MTPHLRRLLVLLGAWAAVPAALLVLGVRPALLWEPRLALFVAGLPWLLAALAFGPTAAPRALGLALSTAVDDAPVPAREAAGARLRELGGLSIAVGTAAFLLDAMAMFRAIAVEGGQGNPNLMIAGLGVGFLAPAYGLLLKVLLYDPLATAAEPSPAELAAELGA